MFGRYAINGYFLLMGKVFVLLACSASLDVVRYPLVHVGPPVAYLGFADGFVPTWVAGGRVIVHERHDTPFYFDNRWYMDLSFRGDRGHNKPLGVE